jgi:hypothetical protein
MRTFLAKIRGLLTGKATIEFVDKIPISKTPGEVTDVGHN